MKSNLRIVGLALLLNLAFWGWFWVDVWSHTSEYTDQTPKHEEAVPVYKFRARALPLEAEQNLMSFGLMLLVQRPSFLLAGHVATFTSGTWEQRVWVGLSIGAFVLIGTMILSFAQWSVIALLGAWAVRVLKGTVRHMIP